MLWYMWMSSPLARFRGRGRIPLAAGENNKGAAQIAVRVDHAFNYSLNITSFEFRLEYFTHTAAKPASQTASSFSWRVLH
jgi:hypothetical protein